MFTNKIIDRYSAIGLNKLIAVLLVWAALLICATAAHGQNFEVSCPLGTTPVGNHVSFDTTTNLYRAWACQDNITGKVTMQADTYINITLALPLTLSTAGVWTNTQQNENFQTIVGTGINCSPSFIFSTTQLGNFATDGISGTACVPATATVQLGVGVAGYATSAEPSSCGATAPPCGGVGLMGTGLSTATGATVWGVVGVVQSVTGATSQMLGGEIDVTPNNSSDTGWGLYEALNNSNGANNFIAHEVNVTGANRWAQGLVFATGSIVQTSLVAPAIVLNQNSGGNSRQSQAIIFNPTNPSGVVTPVQLIGGVDASGNPILTTIQAEGLFFSFLRTTIYSAAGTPVPTCNANAKGIEAQVSDATTPTFLGTYVSGGAVFSPVVCNGTNWVTF